MIESLDWGEILNGVLKGLGVVIGTLIATYATILFNKLKGKIEEAKLNDFIDKCVRAAEQLFPNLGQKTGAQKFEYVMQEIAGKFPKQLNNPQLKSLIEGAVFSVSEQIRQVAKERQNKNSAIKII